MPSTTVACTMTKAMLGLVAVTSFLIAATSSVQAAPLAHPKSSDARDLRVSPPCMAGQQKWFVTYQAGTASGRVLTASRFVCVKDPIDTEAALVDLNKTLFEEASRTSGVKPTDLVILNFVPLKG